MDGTYQQLTSCSLPANTAHANFAVGHHFWHASYRLLS